MPPAVAVSTLPSGKRSSSREMAEAEDIYFGGDPHQQHPHHQQQQQQHPPQEGLLGQALQIPTTQSMTDNSENAVVEEEHSQSPTSFNERLTPTFVTRKRSDDGGGTRTPMHQNLHHHANISHRSSNNSSKGNHSHHNHTSSGRSTTQRSSSNSLAATRVIDNRGHFRAGSGSSSNNMVVSSSSSQDPLCMSTRSMQSDDSHMAAMTIPQSVDTVPTSNVATLQAYQRHHAQQLKHANHHGSRHHPATAMYANSAASNRRPLHNSPHRGQKNVTVSPPQELRFHPHPSDNNNSANHGQDPADAGRRTVFGNRVRERYPNNYDGTTRALPPPPADPAPFYNIIENGAHITFQQAAPQPPDWENLTSAEESNNNNKNAHHPPPPLSMVVTSNQNSNCGHGDDDDDRHHDGIMTSNITLDGFLASPRNSRVGGPSLSAQAAVGGNPDTMVSPLKSPPLHHLSLDNRDQTSFATTSTTASNTTSTSATTTPSKHHAHNSSSSKKGRSSHHKKHKRVKIHETVHAQSLLLGLCFMAIWSPNNIMAPNLTQIATFYGMSETERDLYLGSFLALATGVLSFPLSAAIGILTDLYPRKILFVGTAFGGALASAATGMSPTYPCLLLARFFSGGFMSASVSVAFSLMGDLFAAEERNAASSGLTAMMGLGIILGQVYAGVVGSTKGWQIGFWISSVVTAVLGLCVAIWVQEPVRGGKEKVLQDMLQQGKRYDRKLTWAGFLNAMRNNRSNSILMAQGFFSSLPFGILFVFFNDYLSQERGFSVPDATFIVLVFGVGCAVGGILGGYLGAWIQSIRRSLLPLFMAATTMLGILPFFGLLNGHTTNAHGYWSIMYAFMGGCFSSMPSVNVRPCLINVNPPETRGASLTAANLIINLARGLGPSCITLLGSSFDMSRQVSFNVTLGVFWTLSAIQLCFLAQTLPQDQDKMEAELALYAASALATVIPGQFLDGTDQSSLMTADEYSLEPDRPDSSKSLADDVSLVSIEDRMTTFDGIAVKESISFIQKGMSELNFHPLCTGPRGGDGSYDDEDDSDPDEIEEFDEEEQQRREDARKMLASRYAGDDTMSPVDLLKRRNMWIQQQQKVYGATGDDDGDDPSPDVDNSAGQGEKKTNKDGPPTEQTRLI